MRTLLAATLLTVLSCSDTLANPEAPDPTENNVDEAAGPFALSGTLSNLTDACEIELSSTEVAETQTLSPNLNTFAFDAKLNAGEFYSVALIDCAEACTLNVSSGLMPKADLTGLTVDCPVDGRPRYSVSGTIHGLDSGEVVLALGEESITLEGQPELPRFDFMFATRMPVGTPYDVELRSMPDAIFCEVQNARGVIEGEANDVGVFCEPRLPSASGYWRHLGTLDGEPIVLEMDLVKNAENIYTGEAYYDHDAVPTKLAVGATREGNRLRMNFRHPDETDILFRTESQLSFSGATLTGTVAGADPDGRPFAGLEVQ